ncbi:MAG TPA: SRPBCC domain-containing protein [Reyranella sp.]|nr:SRPBCC domain-containing protein [Reyranella sp.]
MDGLLKPAEQELVLVRDLKAPRARVFAAWTDPKRAAMWWSPRDCTPLTCEMDVRPGGRWHRTMRIPDGTVIAKYGVYREVVEGERLVFTYMTDYADGSSDPETLVSITLESLGDGTRLTLRHSAFQTEESRISHTGGWTSCLDWLADFVTR